MSGESIQATAENPCPYNPLEGETVDVTVTEVFDESRLRQEAMNSARRARLLLQHAVGSQHFWQYLVSIVRRGLLDPATRLDADDFRRFPPTREWWEALEESEQAHYLKLVNEDVQ